MTDVINDRLEIFIILKLKPNQSGPHLGLTISEDVVVALTLSKSEVSDQFWVVVKSLVLIGAGMTQEILSHSASISYR